MKTARNMAESHEKQTADFDMFMKECMARKSDNVPSDQALLDIMGDLGGKEVVQQRIANMEKAFEEDKEEFQKLHPKVDGDLENGPGACPFMSNGGASACPFMSKE